MSDSDLQITIAADASGVGQGADQAKAAIAGLTSALSGAQSSFAGFGAAVAKAFVAPNVSGLTGAIGQVRTGCAEVAGSMAQAGQAIRGWAAQTAAAKAQAFSAPDLSGVVQAAGQVRSTLDGARPSIAGFGDAFQGISGKIAAGFGGVGAALNGLKTAGAAGAEGLAGLAAVGGGVTTALAAVVGIALGAGAALASWAERTKDSSAATAEARQNAAALSGALAGAGAAFGQIGDTLASAFAPTMTTIVNGLAAMANAFQASYNSGGLAKTSVDLLVASVNLLVAAVTEIVTWWKTEIDAVTDFGRAGSDAFSLLGSLVQDLKTALTSALSPAFKAVQDAAASAWGAIQSGFASLLKVVTAGYDGWKALNAPLVTAITGIGSAFTSVESAARTVFQNILSWIVKVSDGLVAFLEKLPGVGGAFQQLQADLAKTASDAQTNIGSMLAVAQRPQPAAAPPASAAAPQPSAGAASAPAKAAPSGGGDDACGCDPSVVQARATQSQGAQVQATQAAQSQTVATTSAANAQIAASNDGVTTRFVAGAAQQVAAARSADSARATSSAETGEKITASEKKAFDEFKASLNQTVAVFTKGLLEMAEGAKSFSQVMRSIGQQILNDMLKVIDGIIDKWALGVAENVLASTQGQALLNALGMKDLAQAILINARKTASATAQNAAVATAKAAGTATEMASAQAQKVVNAQVAFSGAIAAISPIPFIGPYIAPEMAAEMASLASAAGGFDIPAGVNPLTQLHQQEMVLPARLANPMRDMLSSYGSAGGAPGGGHSFSFGDTHIHGAPNMSPADFKQALSEHRSNVAEAVAGALRGGWRPNYKQPVGAL